MFVGLPSHIIAQTLGHIRSHYDYGAPHSFSVFTHQF